MASYFENSSDALVPDALKGFARAHADLVTLDPEHGFLLSRTAAPSRRVALLSGGGAGHEPLHAGYVGRGMLDAACPGRVFASPHNRQVYAGSLAAARAEGVLHIVKNYTGDRINFGIAAERLAHRGVPCARVLIDDDLASDSADIASGAAHRRHGPHREDPRRRRRHRSRPGRAPGTRHPPRREVPYARRRLGRAHRAHHRRAAFPLAAGELEYGVGIHGERAQQTVPREPLNGLVERMTTALLDALAPEGPVIALVNGLGAVTLLELYAVHGELATLLDARGTDLARALVGDYITALDMRGFSVTLLAADEEILRLYDAPVHTAALRW